MCRVFGLGLRISGLGCWVPPAKRPVVQGLGFRVEGSKFGISGYKVWGLGCWVPPAKRPVVQNSGLRVHNSGFQGVSYGV